MLIIRQEVIDKCTHEILAALEENTDNTAEAIAVLENIHLDEHSVISLSEKNVLSTVESRKHTDLDSNSINIRVKNVEELSKLIQSAQEQVFNLKKTILEINNFKIQVDL
ncbi:hypothetical protein [Lactiplantibacillus plantarum]|uniref:hypothetical protein n=1 Tax=Lactiplantibacillus plantarum TaxID=1590 RepID=UPI000E672328|nr:hypothetical protein [Lactiplantibacillus plantarum]RXE75991.1 hypothetical protein D7Y65_14880 [Lactiplantibacillus plantarum]